MNLALQANIFRIGLTVVLLTGRLLSLQDAPIQAANAKSSSHDAGAQIEGIVLKDPGSEPVKKAVIELIAEKREAGGNHTALTSEDGRFRIDNILPGRYRLFVERTGYQEVNERRRPTEGRVLGLSAGQKLTDLTLHLQASAVVEGRITDEDGDPIADTQVTVLRRKFVAGHNQLEQVRAERANDLGEYRIAGLSAGTYYVSVTPPPDLRGLIESAGETQAPPQSAVDSKKPAPLAYQTTFYPGTRDRGQAAPIQLHAGDEFPANFSLTPSATFAIRGSVVSLPPGATASVMLQSKDFNVVLNSGEMRKDGTFEIRDVAPGAYTIVATIDDVAEHRMARQSLQIDAASVEGLRLAPQSGGTVRGRIRFESGGKAEYGGLQANQMFLLLRSADSDEDSIAGIVGAETFSPLVQVNPDGTFQWNNVPSGHYFVQISDSTRLPSWYLKSVGGTGQDLSDSGFSLNGGTFVLDVLASASGATLEGQATNEKNEPVADATIVAVPEQRFRARPDLFRKALADQAGRFTLEGLPPGEYTLLAWESLTSEAYFDPEFLKHYEVKGKVLHLKERDRVNVQLKVVLEEDDDSEQNH